MNTNDIGREEFAAPATVYTMAGGPMGDPLHYYRESSIITEHTALTIPAFLRAVTYLSGTLAGLPKHIYRRNGDRRERVYNTLSDRLNNDVNELVDPFDFWRTLYHHAIVWGNGYAAIAPDGAMYNLMPDRVTPFRMRNDTTGEVQQWYRVELEDNKPYPVPAHQMFTVHGLGFDGQQGYPLVELMSRSLRIGKSAEEYGDKFFQNGATVGGALTTDQKLTPEQMTTMRQSIQQGHTGVNNAFKWMILHSGIEPKPFNMPNNHAQWIETRQFSILDVCRATGVPPHKVFDLGRATWSNIEHQGIEVVQDLFSSWVIPSEQQVARKLMTRAERAAGFYCKFNMDALQRGDHTQQIDSAAKRFHSGLTTLNYELALMDLPADPVNGEKRLVPANLTLLDRVGVEPQAPAESQPPAEFTAEPAPVEPEGTKIGEVFVEVKAVEAPAEPAKIGIEHFTTLIDDAASRVGTKSDNAEASARKKHGEDRQAFTVWANVFSESQSAYASAAVAPILKTAATMGVELEPDDAAAKIGTAYAAQLRRHLYDNTGKKPDLTAITMKAIKGEDEPATETDVQHVE